MKEQKAHLENTKTHHKVEIKISCKNLPNSDFGPNAEKNKADPYAVLYVKADTDETWTKVGKTETIWNKPDPVFPERFKVNYLFEKNQLIRVEIYDDDADQKVLGGDDDLIGFYVCPINKILTSHKQTVKGDLRLAAGRGGSASNGRVIVVADAVPDSNNRAKMTFRCSLWPKKTQKKQFLCWCKPEPDNPFLLVERAAVEEDEIEDAWIPCYRSSEEVDE